MDCHLNLNTIVKDSFIHWFIHFWFCAMFLFLYWFLLFLCHRFFRFFVFSLSRAWAQDWLILKLWISFRTLSNSICLLILVRTGFLCVVYYYIGITCVARVKHADSNAHRHLITHTHSQMYGLLRLSRVHMHNMYIYMCIGHCTPHKRPFSHYLFTQQCHHEMRSCVGCLEFNLRELKTQMSETIVIDMFMCIIIMARKSLLADDHK